MSFQDILRVGIVPKFMSRNSLDRSRALHIYFLSVREIDLVYADEPRLATFNRKTHAGNNRSVLYCTTTVDIILNYLELNEIQ